MSVQKIHAEAATADRLDAIRHSIASDDRINAETRQHFAAMTDAKLVEAMDIIAEFQALPARERKAFLILAKRLTQGDEALHLKLKAANRGELDLIEEMIEEGVA